MKKMIPIYTLVVALLALTSCGKLLDGKTSDGVSLEVAAGDATGGGGSGTASCSSCKIFVTATTTNGGLGATPALAIAAADALCMADANKPAGGGTYKALLASSVRQAPSTDWPLKASTNYVQSNGTTAIATTTAGRVFTFPMTNIIDGMAQAPWTGLTGAWGLGGSNCVDFTSNNVANTGSFGSAGAANSTVIFNGTDFCNNSGPLYCVEQ